MIWRTKLVSDVMGDTKSSELGAKLWPSIRSERKRPAIGVEELFKNSDDGGRREVTELVYHRKSAITIDQNEVMLGAELEEIC